MAARVLVSRSIVSIPVKVRRESVRIDWKRLGIAEARHRPRGIEIDSLLAGERIVDGHGVFHVGERPGEDPMLDLPGCRVSEFENLHSELGIRRVLEPEETCRVIGWDRRSETRLAELIRPGDSDLEAPISEAKNSGVLRAYDCRS